MNSVTIAKLLFPRQIDHTFSITIPYILYHPFSFIKNIFSVNTLTYVKEHLKLLLAMVDWLLFQASFALIKLISPMKFMISLEKLGQETFLH